MLVVMKKLLFVVSILVTSLAYCQETMSGPFHFDGNFTVTGSGKALYKGYTQRESNSFVTTIFAASSKKIARLTHSDRTLTLKQGEIIVYNSRGNVAFISHYNKNRLHGNWISWYDNRLICDSGKFVNNLPDGIWKTWYPEGKLRSVRSYSASKWHVLNDELKKHPRFTFFPLTDMIRNNRDAYNAYTGAGQSYSTLPRSVRQDIVYDGSLKKIVDLNTTQEDNGYFPPFTQCLHHGLYMNFYPEGTIKDSGYYKNGLREGVWEEWLENGTIRSIGFYHHGTKKNTWKYYTSGGKLLYIQHYNHQGKPVGAKEFSN